MLGFVPFVFLLVILAIVLAVVVAARSRTGDGLAHGAEDTGMGTVKRLYFYGVAFAALMVAANGVTILLGAVIERLLPGGVLRASPVTQLSLGLALTIVATPLWLVHWTYVQRQVRKEPVELRSVLRKLYIYLLLGVGMAFMVVAAIGLLRWAFRLEPFPYSRTGSLVVWACLWWYHWHLETREGQATADTQTVRRWYVYLTATYGLWLAVTGLGFALHLVLRYGYDALFSVPVLLKPGAGLWGQPMGTSLAISMVGSAVWSYHWLRAARGDVESALRQVYLNIFALLPGIVTMLTSATVALFTLLDWGLGGAAPSSPATHFRVLPSALATLAAGAAIWGYHWSVTQREAAHVAGKLQAARRAYGYVMAGLGLATLVGGVVTLLATLVGFASPSDRSLLAGASWWRSPLALSLTLIVIGAPIYGYYWRNIQGQALSRGRAERASLSRRTLVYLALGLAMLGLLGAPSHILFLLLRALLEGTISVAILREARWSIGVLGAAAMVFPYYWQVLREDRRTGAEEHIARKAITVVAGPTAQSLISQIEAALGQRVHVIRSLEPETTAPELAGDGLTAVAARVNGARGRNILLLLADGDLRVVSYD